MPLQIRRGSVAEANALVVPPADGELIWVKGDVADQLFIGDGVTQLKDLSPVTGYSDTNAIEAVKDNLVAANSLHRNIEFSYQAGSIVATVDLSDGLEGTEITADILRGSAYANDSTLVINGETGTLVGPINTSEDVVFSGNVDITNATFTGAFVGTVDGILHGSVFAQDSTPLVDAIGGGIELDGTVKGHVVPDTDELYDLGSPTKKFRDLYLSGSSLHLGTATITSSGGILDLPAGTTINGAPIDLSGGLGSINVSVVGDDSTLIIDASENTISTGILTLSGNSINSTFGRNEVRLSNDTIIFKEGGSTVIADDPTYPFYELYLSNDGSDISSNLVYAHRGTQAAPTSLSTGDDTWAQAVLAHDGTDYRLSSAISTVAGGVSPGNTPGWTYILSIPNNDLNQATGIVVTEQGTGINIPIGNTPAASLEVQGSAIISGTVTADLIGSVIDNGSTVLVDGLNGQLMYYANNAADWSGNAPTNVQDALDRIAAALGPIA